MIEIEFGWVVVMSCRGGKSVATWQPSCQKVFEETGSDRKFLDPSLRIKLFGRSVKEIILGFLQNGHFLINF